MLQLRDEDLIDAADLLEDLELGMVPNCLSQNRNAL